MMRFTAQRSHRTFRQPPGRENARAPEEYATVKAVLAQRTDKAILLSRDDLVAAVWVPRHALDARGKLAADKAVLKSEITIGVELELAMEKGLA